MVSALGMLNRNLPIDFFQIGPGNIGIVSKNREPVFGDGLGIVFFAVLNGFQWKQIVCHDPGYVEMPGGGDQVRDITGSAPAAADAREADRVAPRGAVAGTALWRSAKAARLSDGRETESGPAGCRRLRRLRWASVPSLPNLAIWATHIPRSPTAL